MNRKKRISKKEKGFTLIEVSAVLAIIAILMVFFIPNVTGYIKDAKKTAAIAQGQTVVLAWETVNTKETEVVNEETTKDELIAIVDKNKDKYKDHFDLSKTKNIGGAFKVSDCLQLVNGANFELDDKGFVAITGTSETEGLNE